MQHALCRFPCSGPLIFNIWWCLCTWPWGISMQGARSPVSSHPKSHLWYPSPHLCHGDAAQSPEVPLHPGMVGCGCSARPGSAPRSQWEGDTGLPCSIFLHCPTSSCHFTDTPFCAGRIINHQGSNATFLAAQDPEVALPHSYFTWSLKETLNLSQITTRLEKKKGFPSFHLLLSEPGWGRGA